MRKHFVMVVLNDLNLNFNDFFLLISEIILIINRRIEYSLHLINHFHLFIVPKTQHINFLLLSLAFQAFFTNLSCESIFQL